MIVGDYKDDEKYCVIATMVVKGGVDNAFSCENVPGRLVKRLESVMNEILDYCSKNQ